jgi:hypothetical protein
LLIEPLHKLIVSFLETFQGDPWSITQSPGPIIQLDLSCEKQLDDFIERYRYIIPDSEKTKHEVDWRKVQQEFGGIFFINAEVYELPKPIYKKYSKDGYWILSIDVDSFCIWNKEYLDSLDTRWSLAVI